MHVPAGARQEGLCGRRAGGAALREFEVLKPLPGASGCGRTHPFTADIKHAVGKNVPQALKFQKAFKRVSRSSALAPLASWTGPRGLCPGQDFWVFLPSAPFVFPQVFCPLPVNSSMLCITHMHTHLRALTGACTDLHTHTCLRAPAHQLAHTASFTAGRTARHHIPGQPLGGVKFKRGVLVRHCDREREVFCE